MRLADDIVVMIGSENIRLIPRLRFAIRLERRGSFAALIQQVQEDSFTAACDLISDHTTITPVMQKAILAALPDLRGPLLTYVLACTGVDPDQSPSERKGNSVPFADHLTQLFRIGSGHIGWTPTQTLDATPAEIMQAAKGRVELLRSIFGGAEKDSQPKGDWGSRFAFTARARTKAAEAA
ncbi:hypothetical protein ABFT80_07210 [Mesorhizobium sp. SB112]|uniref:hypothetical protein n=1 Tax=Mesorhizobium sp. SB112 TaxID=3151853 RepID=UPI003263033F